MTNFLSLNLLDKKTVCNPNPELKQQHPYQREKQMNEKAERINGWAAMIGIVAAMGSYAATGQIIPGIW